MCSYLCGGAGLGRQPQIPGHGWVLADAAKLFSVRCASAGREWWPEASTGVSLPWTAEQPGVARQSYEKVTEGLQRRKKELSLLRAKIDVLDQQITRLNKSVLFHQDKLR